MNNKNEEQMLLIQGDSGSGKSLFGKYLTNLLWKNYNKSSNDIIPIFVFLAQYYSNNSTLNKILSNNILKIITLHHLI